MANYDVIVIGADHNGLAASTILVREGLKVLSLEKNKYVGGMASTVKYFKGFKFDVAVSILFPFSDKVVGAL
jgi:phytoene dehydrogenase-like protein